MAAFEPAHWPLAVGFSGGADSTALLAACATRRPGEVVAFHLSRAIYDGQRVDAARMRPIARLGGPYYAGLGEIVERPMLQKPPGGEGWVPPESGLG
eukprot:gene42954-57124_t